MLFGGGAAREREERSRLQAHVAELERRRDGLQEKLQGFQEGIDAAKAVREERALARQKDLEEAGLRRCAQLQSDIDEQRRQLSEAQARFGAARRAIEDSKDEFTLLQAAGLEPSHPQLLLEVWEAAPRLRFLGEQWLPEAMVCQALGWQKLSLVSPRLLLSRPAAGKGDFDATAPPRAGRLQVQFKVASAGEEGAESGKALYERRALRKFRVAKDVRKDALSPHESGSIVLRLWRWGDDELAEGVGPAAAVKDAAASLPPEVATSMDAAHDVVAAPGNHMDWYLEVVEAVDSIGDALQRLHQREHCYQLELKPGGSPVVVGRTLPMLKALLASRDDLLRTISRQHLQFTLAPDGSGVIAHNLSHNPVAVGDALLQQGEEAGPLKNGERLTFMTQNQSADAADANHLDADELEESSGRARAHAAAGVGDMADFAADGVEGASPYVEPFMTLALFQGRLGNHRPKWSARGDAANRCANGSLCVGAGGDLLFSVVDPMSASQRTRRPPMLLVYCGPCLTALQARQGGLEATALPDALPARWTLVLESPAAVTQALPDRRGWQAEMSGQALAPWLMPAKLGPSPRDAQELEDLEKSVRKLTEEKGALKLQLQLAQTKTASFQGSRAGRSPSQPATANSPPSRRALTLSRATPESSPVDERLLARPEDQMTLIRAAAEPLLPPTGGKLELANHRRLLRCLREGTGLIYRDASLEVHATVHAPTVVEPESSANGGRPGSSLNLRASIDVRFQSRKVSSDLDELVGGDQRPPLFRLNVNCEDVDHSALVFGVRELPPEKRPALAALYPQASERPAGAPGRAEFTASYSVDFELIEGFFAGHPKLVVEASIGGTTPPSPASSPGAYPSGGAAAPSNARQHRCSFLLPLSVTTFLRPMSASLDFEAMWASLARTEPVKLTVPALSPEASDQDYQSWLSPAAVCTNSSAGDASAGGSAANARAALSCGGALRALPLAGGAAGLAAELPPHGCVHDALPVLVRVAVVAAGGAPAGAWELRVRCGERRLAEAVAAAVATQLHCPPR